MLSYVGSDTNRELVKVIHFVSCQGTIIPPIVNFPGKVHQEYRYTGARLKNNCLIVVFNNEYTYDYLALRWLTHVEKFTYPKDL